MVEIIGVVIIIAVLAALVAPKFFSQIGKAKSAVAKQKLTEVEGAIDRFFYEHSRFPRTLDELVERPSDIAEDQWNPSLKAKDLVDPWGRPFEYRNPGPKYELLSYGANGQEGGGGEDADIKNE